MNNDNVRSRRNDNFDYEKAMETSLREENDAMISKVLSNVKNIKNFTLQIQNNIKMSNQTCEDMNKKYDDSTSLMGDTLRKLGLVLSSNSTYWCYLIIFIFVVFFFLYKITN